MKAQILYRTPGETRRFELTQGEAILGREPGALVEVATEGVAGRHARVTWDGRNHWIEDLKSATGTFLNGQSVLRDKLRHLDVISLGRKVDLLFVKHGLGRVVTTRGIVAAALVPAAPDAPAIPLPLGETSLGRSAACNVVLDEAAISKMHARLERSAEQVVVHDLESVNGTFVNGARVTMAVLRDQDLLSLAGVEDFHVSLESGEVVTTAAEAAAVSSRRQSTKPVPRFSENWKTRFDLGRDLSPEAIAVAVPAPPAGPPEAATLVLPNVPGALRESDGLTLRPGAAAESARRIAQVRLAGTGLDLVVSEPGLYSLGRAADAALRVNHATVSRQHARLILTEDRASALVQDLGGASGTLLNGALLKKAEPLAEGDIVQIGEVKLLVQIRLQPRN